MKTIRFKRRLFGLLELNDRGDLIPLFSEKLKKLPREGEKEVILKKFEEILMDDFGFSKSQSRIFSKNVYGVEKHRHKIKSKTLKEKFKNVIGSRPVQGGSPGLGKGKS